MHRQEEEYGYSAHERRRRNCHDHCTVLFFHPCRTHVARGLYSCMSCHTVCRLGLEATAYFELETHRAPAPPNSKCFSAVLVLLGPGRLAVLERWLHYPVTIHCIGFGTQKAKRNIPQCCRQLFCSEDPPKY